MNEASRIKTTARDQTPAYQTIAGLAVSLHGDPDGVPVLMSAGLGGQGGYWTPQLEALSDHRVILYDHRGTGASMRGELPEGYGVAHMAQDMALILKGLGCGPAHIVGHAAGAVAGLQLALDAPDLVRSVVSVNGWAVADAHFKRCFEIRRAIYRSGGPEAYLAAQPLFLFPAAWISDHLDELDEQAAHHVKGFQSETNLFRRMKALSSFDICARLGDITCPVLVLASADDMLVPSRCSEILAAGLPDATLELMPWGGHACNITAPQDFERRLRTFFGRF